MGRRVRDYRLDTPESRSKLPRQHEPIYRTIIPGLAIGYRKGARSGTWSGRKRADDVYEKWHIGTADDIVEADGVEVLSFAQADAKVRFGPSGSTGKMETVNDAMDYYMEQQRAEARSAPTTQYAIDRHITAIIGRKRISKLTVTSIKKWRNNLAAPRTDKKKSTDSLREQRRKRQATANRILTIFKAALNLVLMDGKYRGETPWKLVKPFKDVDVPEHDFFSRDEAIRLQNACTADFRLLVRGALETGCRYGELTSMKMADFNSDSGTVRVRESKSGRVRHVNLTVSGQDFFDELVADKKRLEFMFLRADGEPWGKSHQMRPMRKACKKAKISPPLSFKALRTTYGSLLAMEGVPLQVIGAALGHKGTRITEQHYAHLLPDHIADTIRDKLPTFSNTKSKVKRLKQK